MTITTAKLFALKDYAKALEHKEQMGAIMRRIWVNETMGNMYEVRYIPQSYIDPDILKIRNAYVEHISFL